MISIPERLRTNYVRLKKMPWAQEEVPLTEEDLECLQDLLNGSQPETDSEHAAKDAVRLLFSKNRSEFYNFLRSNRILSLIFWTDAATILGHFKLNKRVWMKWDGSKYSVGAKTTKPTTA